MLKKLSGNTQRSATDPVKQQIRHLLDTGTLAQQSGNSENALETFREGLEFARHHGELRAEQFFLSGLGVVNVEAENYEDAETQLQEALNMARTLDDPVLIARSLNNLGELHAARREWDRAQKTHEQALEMSRPTSDGATITLNLESLARDYIEQQNPTYAIHLLKEAVIIAQSRQDMQSGARVIGKLGEANLLTGERAVGRKLLEQALSISRQINKPHLMLRWIKILASTAMEDRDYHSAIQHYQSMETLSAFMGQEANFFLELSLNMSKAYYNVGHYQNALEQAERALMHAEQSGNETQIALAKGYTGLGLQGLRQEEKALPYLQEALKYYEDGQLNDQDEYSRLLMAMGRAHHRNGNIEDARKLYDTVRQMAVDSDNPLREAEVLQLIGNTFQDHHSHEQAILYWQDALRIFKSHGQYASIARTLCDIGNARRMEGNLNTALTEFEKASLKLSNIDDRVTRGMVLSNIANLYTEMGELETARSFYEEAIQIARELNDKQAETLRTGNVGWFYVLTGKFDQAIPMLESSITAARDMKNNLMAALQTANLGWAYYLQKDYATAHNLTQQALSLIKTADSPRWRAHIYSNLAMILIKQNQLEEAGQMLEQALTDSQTVKDEENLVQIRCRQARWFLENGQLNEAETQASETGSQARKMGFRRVQAMAAHILGDLETRRENREAARSHYQTALKHYHVLQSPVANEVEALL